MSWRNLKGGFLRSFSVNGGFFMYFPSVSCVRFTTSGRISSLISDYITKHISRHNLKSNYTQLEPNLATKHSWVQTVPSAFHSESNYFTCIRVNLWQRAPEVRLRLYLACVSGLGSSERTHCSRAFQDVWLVTVIISVANHLEISFFKLKQKFVMNNIAWSAVWRTINFVVMFKVL
jgi:hypothetical protein